MKTLLIRLAVAFAMLIPALPAQAACGVGAPRYLNYTFSQLYEVRAIAKYNEYLPSCGSGIANSDTAPVGASALTDVFAKRDPVGRTLLMGVASNLPGDPEGQQHLVLFTNNAWAQNAQSIAFGTLFPTTLEGSLIGALNSLAAGTGSSNDYAKLFDFAGNAALFGPAGDAAFSFGNSFTAIAFSDGQIIGTGQSFYSFGAVPEPASWAMMIIGFGLIGGAMRSKRRAGTAFA